MLKRPRDVVLVMVEEESDDESVPVREGGEK